MPLSNRHHAVESIRPSNLDTKRFNKFVRENFGVQPYGYKNDGTSAASGTTGATNILSSPNSLLEYFILGAGQTITVPVWDATKGLDISLDKTDNEGLEITGGIDVYSQGSFTVATDRAFYVKATLQSTDASGSDELVVGFRKNQAYQATITSYTDYAWLGLRTSADPGVIKTGYRKNSGSVGTSDVGTWADSATKTLKVLVNDDGYVRFFLNEVQVGYAGFQFDTGDVVNWMVRHLHATDVTDALYLVPQTLTLGGISVPQPALEVGYARRNGE